MTVDHAEHSCLSTQVALAWVLRNVSSPIVGFNSIKRVDQGIVDGELTDYEAAYLEEPYVYLSSPSNSIAESLRPQLSA